MKIWLNPGVGSCAMLGTANTMCSLAESLGLALPGTAAIPAVMAARMEAGVRTGEAIMELVHRGITSKDILTRNTFENAMIHLLSMGALPTEFYISKLFTMRRDWESWSFGGL